MKKLLFLLTLLILPTLLFAENFYIDRYDIDVTLNEDGSAHIDENLLVVFTNPSHGIYRDIQDVFENPTNMWKDILADVSNISSNLPFSVENSSEFTSIKIGSSSSLMEGPQEIRISYDYDLGGDIYPDYDEFYYNFISAAWDTEIRNINIRATFPKPVDEDLLFITYGSYGSDKRLPFDFSDDRMTISAHIDKLSKYQAVTLRAEMEEGYFSKSNIFSEKKNGILIASGTILSILFLLYAFISYKRYGVDEELTPPITFYPPKDYNPMDVGYVYDHSLDMEKEITAMFYYWADKGYLKIREDDGDITLIKQKDIPSEECEAERMLFVMVFQRGDEVTLEDLERSNFYIKVPEKIFPKVTAQFRGKCALEDEKSKKMKSVNNGLLLLSTVLISVVVSLEALGVLTLVLSISSIVVLVISTAIFSSLKKNWDIKKLGYKIGMSIPIIIVWILASIFVGGVYLTLNSSSLVLLASASTILCLILSSLLIVFSDKRIEYGQKKLEEILGYKDFIERVEIDKLKTLIDSDPEIFYHTLSFAIVFNLEEKWAKKFESLYIPQCTWYYSSSDALFDAMFYSSLIRRSRRQIVQFNNLNIQNSMPKSGGGGSSSFSGSSGFSGGGFSGGGGRSW